MVLKSDLKQRQQLEQFVDVLVLEVHVEPEAVEQRARDLARGHEDAPRLLKLRGAQPALAERRQNISYQICEQKLNGGSF